MASDIISDEVLLQSLRPDSDYLKAIGLVVVWWAYLENTMRVTIASMSDAPVESGFILTNGMNPYTMIKMMRTFLHLKDPGSKAEFDKIVKEIETCYDIRNLVAHSVWNPGKQNGKLQPVHFIAGKNPKHQIGEASATDLTEDARAICEIAVRLIRFMKKRGIVTAWKELAEPQVRAHRARKPPSASDNGELPKPRKRRPRDQSPRRK